MREKSHGAQQQCYITPHDEENVRDYMHWRTKHSYTRAAAAAMKERQPSKRLVKHVLRRLWVRVLHF
eukprot:5868174-Amphidinium_carterae.1